MMALSDHERGEWHRPRPPALTHPSSRLPSPQSRCDSSVAGWCCDDGGREDASSRPRWCLPPPLSQVRPQGPHGVRTGNEGSEESVPSSPPRVARPFREPHSCTGPVSRLLVTEELQRPEVLNPRLQDARRPLRRHGPRGEARKTTGWAGYEGLLFVAHRMFTYLRSVQVCTQGTCGSHTCPRSETSWVAEPESALCTGCKPRTFYFHTTSRLVQGFLLALVTWTSPSLMH